MTVATNTAASWSPSAYAIGALLVAGGILVWCTGWYLFEDGVSLRYQDASTSTFWCVFDRLFGSEHGGKLTGVQLNTAVIIKAVGVGAAASGVIVAALGATHGLRRRN